MLKRSAKEKGKLRLTSYFKEFKEGDRVAIILNSAVKGKVNIHHRMQGKTGVVEAKRGNAYVIKVNDGNKEKRFITLPIYLKKLK